MPGEIITIQAGQCGNQVGLEYWNQLAAEHGIQPDGSGSQYPSQSIGGIGDRPSSKSANSRDDRPETYFSVSDDQKYTPRSVLIDMEPSVVTRCVSFLPMLNPTNIHLSENGGGAANNWQKGYSYGAQYQEDLINLIDRECDKCENLSTFQLLHSVAGGTGSGVGSLLLELISDRYGSKKVITTSAIFPSADKTSDVVVQPYNTLLTLKRLIEFSDATLVFENDSLNSVENALFGSAATNKLFNTSTSPFEDANKLISYALATMSNPVRFPSYMYSSNESILSSLVPTPTLKFLTASVAPFADLNLLHPSAPLYQYNKVQESDLLLDLLNDKYKLNRSTPQTNYISMMSYVVGGKLKHADIQKGTLKAQKRTQFVPWTSSSIHVVKGKRSPYLPATDKINGLAISNNTSMTTVFSKILRQYDLLAKREAYINFYTESNGAEERARVLDMFNECKESVLSVIEEYKACQTMSYLEDEILDNDELM